MMKLVHFTISMFILVSNCFGQEKVSEKKFEPIALVNKITFFDSKFDQARFSCGFLLKLDNDTFAVTAKHLFKIIKTDKMNTISFDNGIKNWMLFNLVKPEENVEVDNLINENKQELIAHKATYNEDWLVFAIKENHSKVKALEIRTSPLILGEKLYAIGWTRKMESGTQRVYEFEYFKTLDQRILLKDVIVPDLFGGLSGAPVVDGNGKVVGIVSGKTIDPDTEKSYFSPCTLTGLKSFLETYLKLKYN